MRTRSRFTRVAVLSAIVIGAMTLPSAIDWIRTNEAEFISARHAPALTLASSLVEEALALGADRTQVVRAEPWLIVLADSDWLAVPAGAPPKVHTPAEHFESIIPLPEVRDSWHRQEVVLTAFADSISTSDGSQADVIRGGPCPHFASLELGTTWKRAVAFTWPAG